MMEYHQDSSVLLVLILIGVVQGQSYSLTGISSYGIKGGDFRFTCEIPDGAGLPFLLMFIKDDIETCRVDPDDCIGTSLNNSRQYKCGCINNNNRLYYMNISSLNSSHQANWTCTNFPPTNGRSNIISLPVYNPPTITSIQSNTTNNQTNEGSRVVFSCSVDGLPFPNVTWSRSKDGQLSSSEEYNLPEASCEDTDNYTCRASNNIGLSVSTTIPLYVRCSPREKSTPVTMVRNRINSTLTLEVDIIAYLKPEFTWIFDERNEILRDKVEEMSIINYRSYLKLKLNESMFGNYTVIVNNNVGVPVNFTITVINEDKPEANVKEETDGRIELTVGEGTDGRNRLTVGEGIAIGVGVGFVICLIVTAGVLVFLFRSRRIVLSRKKTEQENPPDNRRQGNIGLSNISPVYEGVGANLHQNNSSTSSPTYESLDEETRGRESVDYQQLNLYCNQHVK